MVTVEQIPAIPDVLPLRSMRSSDNPSSSCSVFLRTVRSTQSPEPSFASALFGGSNLAHTGMSAMQRAVPQTDLAGDNPNEKLPVVQKRAITSMKVDLDRYRSRLVR